MNPFTTNELTVQRFRLRACREKLEALMARTYPKKQTKLDAPPSSLPPVAPRSLFRLNPTFARRVK